MSEYTLLVHNTSHSRVAVAVSPEVEDAAQIAWRTAVVEPFAAARFRWTLRYSFFAARTGALYAGAIVRPSAVAEADPVEGNLVALTYDTSFHFGAVHKYPEAGVLIVSQDGNVPVGRGAVGVAIDGKPAAAVQAQPNIDARFVLHPAWWVITSDGFQEGQLLDKRPIASAHRVVFLDGAKDARVEV
ncbi:MAG: hypothetical protein ACXW31_05975 [Thermoanaerobaculia bacterium]